MNTKTVFLGSVIGLASTWIMTKSQTKIQNLMKKNSDKSEEKEEEQSEDPSTVKLANKVSCLTLNHPVPEDKKSTAGNMVHYGFGTSMGIFFSLLQSGKSSHLFLRGISYGGLVWMVADNILVPLMGLSKIPTKYPLKTHAYALGAHLIYGGALGGLFSMRGRV